MQDIVAVGYGKAACAEYAAGYVCCWSLKNPKVRNEELLSLNRFTCLSVCLSICIFFFFFFLHVYSFIYLFAKKKIVPRTSLHVPRSRHCRWLLRLCAEPACSGACHGRAVDLRRAHAADRAHPWDTVCKTPFKKIGNNFLLFFFCLC